MTDRTRTVLHVTQAFGGGVFSVLRDLTGGLAESGAVRSVLGATIGADTPTNFREQLHEAVEFFELDLPGTAPSPGWPFDILTAVWRLRSLVQDVKPDVVHLHSSVAGMVGRLALGTLYRRERIRLFYTPHGLAFLRSTETRAKKGLYRIAESIGHSFGGSVVACGPAESEIYARNVLGGRRRNTLVIPNGVDVPPYSAPRRKNSSRPLVGAMGRLTPAKRPEVFAHLAKAFPEADFTWIGDGEDHYRQNLTEAGVHVTGWLDRASATERLKSMDAYVQFSAWEGLSLALLEAMGLALPVVASDIPANRDVIEVEVTGLLATTVDQARSELGRLLGSPALRETLGTAARSRVRDEYSVELMVNRYRDLYLDGRQR